ncbi:DUF3800 domain-containing protein [Pseudonocardia oroxyli]|nr:DUF3800 domain-containing protein [Pseudonocardia oroxyli]
MPETAARPLAAALDNVMLRAASSFDVLDPTTELHAHELVNAKGAWKPMKAMLRARIGIFEAVLGAIAEHDAKFIAEGIDRTKLAERYATPDDPHPLALMYVMERVNEYTAQITRTSGIDTYALVVADEVDQHDEHRRSLWVGQRQGTWGYKAQVLDRIVDTIHFVPSHSTRLIQASDVATYLYRRRAVHSETDARSEAAWARLYELLRPQIVRARIWP